MAIKIRFLSDIADLLRGTKKAEEGIDDVEDSLKDVARAGDKTEKQVGQNFREMGKDADKASDKIKTGFKEAGEEAGQSGREAAASFSGGLEDVADFAQETLANALGGFGPAGAAAGVALAAGIGAALQGLADQQERLEQAREAAADLASTLYENNGELPVTEQVDRLIQMLTQERAARGLESLIDGFADLGTNLDVVKQAAKITGQNTSDLYRVLGGRDAAGAREALKGVNEDLDELYKQREQNSHGLFPNIQPLESMKLLLEGVVTEAEIADATLAAVGSSFDSEAAQEKIRTLGEAWQDNAVDAENYFTETEDGATAFDWETYLSNAEAALQAANDYKRKIVTLPDDIQTEAESIFATAGAQSANAYIDAYIGADTANKGRFEAAAAANSSSVGKAAGEAMATAAEQEARRKAQGWGSLPPIKISMVPDDTAVKKYVPPRKQAYIDYKARQVV